MTIQDTIPIYPSKLGLPTARGMYDAGHTVTVIVSKDYFFVTGPFDPTDRYYFRIKLKPKK